MTKFIDVFIEYPAKDVNPELDEKITTFFESIGCKWIGQGMDLKGVKNPKRDFQFELKVSKLKI